MEYTTFNFDCDITKKSITDFIKLISEHIRQYYETRDIGDELTVKYTICTSGGSIVEMLRFIDFIEICKNKYPKLFFISVATNFCYGLLMTCTAHKRLIENTADVYLCAVVSPVSSNMCFGDLDFESYTDNLNNMILDIYVKNSKLSKEELHLLTAKTVHLSAEDCITRGFADEIC